MEFIKEEAATETVNPFAKLKTQCRKDIAVLAKEQREGKKTVKELHRSMQVGKASMLDYKNWERQNKLRGLHMALAYMQNRPLSTIEKVDNDVTMWPYSNKGYAIREAQKFFKDNNDEQPSFTIWVR